MFDTTDAKSHQERLFHGDRELAKRLLDPWIGKAPVSLVLINSHKRGGAGGQPGFSAWSSVAPLDGERWEAVCLHELGHGFGLADEYLDDKRAHEHSRGEPNVSVDGRPSRTPWHLLANQPDMPSPSFTLATERASPPSAVGTFQGARYRSDLYRAARTCLMLDTTQPFCPACCAHILEIATSRAQLAGPVRRPWLLNFLQGIWPQRRPAGSSRGRAESSPT